jgi:hypothetical protein
MLATTSSGNTTTADMSDCAGDLPIHSSLSSATSLQLRKLAQYEQVCGGAVASSMSFFVPTPTSPAEADEYARSVAAQLHDFSSHGISPIVFFEPTSSTGLVDRAAYRAGDYDAALDGYFAHIRARGITDAMMGLWVPLPEGNLPVWSSVHADDFAACVTKAVSYQKKYFPHSRAGILLDTQTYPVSGSWVDGKVASLLPYVKDMPEGLIDSVGLQGMPWSPAADEAGPTNGMPRDYLRTDLLVELARAMDIRDVWVNTGTFGVKYAAQPGRQITVTAPQRLAQLHGVVTAVKSLQTQDFSVAVHLFAQDKSAVAESTDWSYWPNKKATSSSSTIAFKTLVHELQAANIPLWLFDIE